VCIEVLREKFWVYIRIIAVVCGLNVTKKSIFFHTGTATPQTSAFNACACRSILLITCNCCEVVFKFLWSKVIIIIIRVYRPVFQDSLDKPVPEWQIILDFNAARRQWCRALRHTKLQSDYHHMSISSPFLTGQMPFLSPNQQCQNTEGKLLYRTVLTWGTSALQSESPPRGRGLPLHHRRATPYDDVEIQCGFPFWERPTYVSRNTGP